MKTVIIVQARMTSTRLPGKVMKTVMNKPLLEYQIERLKQVSLADEIVIATTTNEVDQAIVNLCDRLSISYLRGSEQDVLERYYKAATVYHADTIVRVTSDCPLIDPAVIDHTVNVYLSHYPTYDYVSNSLQRTYPRGMDTEVFSFAALQQAFLEARSEPDREHVTPFLYRNPQRFRLVNVAYSTDMSSHRWTVDTPEDFELIRHMLETLYPKNPNFSLEDSLALLEQYPDWSQINAHVEQKQYGQ